MPTSSSSIDARRDPGVLADVTLDVAATYPTVVLVGDAGKLIEGILQRYMDGMNCTIVSVVLVVSAVPAAAAAAAAARSYLCSSMRLFACSCTLFSTFALFSLASESTSDDITLEEGPSRK
jgi:hypothetical protein